MNKYCGYQSDFSFCRKGRNRTVIGYGLESIERDNLYTWYELYFYNKQTGYLDFNTVRDAIIADIDGQTDAKILNGYQWTILHGDDAGKTINVWLSKENQSNFKAKHDTATQYPQLTTYPIVYKVGEVEEEDGIKRPVYEHFQDVNELAQFYLGGLAYIEQTLAEGWARKDSIDWTPYKEYFPEESISNEDS